MAFRKLKSVLQTAPVLQLPVFFKPFFVTTDASGYCVGGVLSQMYNGHDHPLAFYSKKLGTHELNWPTHEKELFAIKLVLDNSACQWLLHHPRVSAKLARFLTFFAEFDFTLHYLKGSMNVVADALSRPPEHAVSNALLSPHMAPPFVNTISFHTCTPDCDAFGSRYHVIDDYRSSSQLQLALLLTFRGRRQSMKKRPMTPILPTAIPKFLCMKKKAPHRLCKCNTRARLVGHLSFEPNSSKHIALTLDTATRFVLP